METNNERLTVLAALNQIDQIINNLTYEDGERVMNIISQRKLNNIYYIKSCEDGVEDCYVLAKDEEDASIKFIESSTFDVNDAEDIIEVTEDICRICGLEIEGIDKEDSENTLSHKQLVRNHLEKCHSYSEMLSFYIDLFNIKYECEQVDINCLEVYSILKRLNIKDCVSEKDMEPMFVFSRNGVDKHKIRSKDEEHAIKLLSKKENFKIFAMKVHINVICEGKCENDKHKRSKKNFCLCEKCKNNVRCFICNVILVDGEHFYTHTRGQIPDDILIKYIRSEYKIEERKITEYVERIQR